MKPAIYLDYCCDQNEPSKPCSQVVWIPNDQAGREALLAELFSEVFDDDDDLRFGFGDTNDQSSYCDLYVSDGCDKYLLFTYLTGKRPSLEGEVE